MAGQSVKQGALLQNRVGAERALGRALDFLLERQLPSGEFRPVMSIDPSLLQGCEPDPAIFPTALIAHSLSFTAAAGKLRERALAFLLDEVDANGLWRHWPRTHPHARTLPPDLDDTCCASAVLRDAGREFAAHRVILLENRDRRGLFYTWIAPRLIRTGVAYRRLMLRQLCSLPVLVLFFRNTSAQLNDVDAVVNANALHYLGDFPGRQRVVDHLLGVLRTGSEADCDKWYTNPFVIWYFFARALAEDVPEARELIEQRLASARANNALENALGACALLYCGRQPSEPEIATLLAAQLESGGWPRAPLYYGGRHRLRDGTFKPAHPHTPHWGSEELTTAFCIEALARWMQLP